MSRQVNHNIFSKNRLYLIICGIILVTVIIICICVGPRQKSSNTADNAHSIANLLEETDFYNNMDDFKQYDMSQHKR